MNRWPLRTSPFWAEAPFFHVLVPLVLSIAAYDFGWLKGSQVWPIVAFCLLLVMIGLAILKKHSGFTKSLFITAFYTSVFAFGAWLSQVNDIRMSPDWFANHKDTTMRSLIKVLEAPAEKEHIWRMRVAVEKKVGQEKAVCVSGEAFLNIYKRKTDPSFSFEQGDRLLVPSRWDKLANSHNPFEVDYKTINRRRNICHQQFVAQDEVKLFQKASNTSPGLLEKVHQYCDEQLARYVTDSVAHGLLLAMLLGDESGFDQDLRQAYSETGVIHIVSISGSHVAVLFGAVVFLLSAVKGKKGAWLRFIIGLFVTWFYVLMAGAPPSAIRAALMFSVIAVGSIFSREAQPLNTLFAAAVMLLCYHPAWLFGVGFQLSFGAVLSLILFYQPMAQVIRRYWNPTSMVGKWLLGGLAGSLAAEVLTAPLVLYYFHNFPVFFIVANILAAILVGVIALLGGMLIIVFSMVPPIANLIALIVTFFINAFNRIIIVLQSWNPTSFKNLQIDRVELVLLYLLVIGFSTVWLLKKKAGLYLGLFTALLLLMLLCRDQWIISHQDKLIVYNVSRHDLIERIVCNHYQIIRGDTSKAAIFTTKSAHTGLGAWKYSKIPSQDYFIVKGKKVLVLDAFLKQSDSTNLFPVDVLIINCPLKGQRPTQLQRVFHPKIIVAGGNQPRWLVQRWVDSCSAQNIPFHAVSISGAFVLE